jgi:hypothetical protein
MNVLFSAESIDEAAASLAALPEIEYDRIRVAEARRLGCRVGTLDSLVRAARGRSEGGMLQGRALQLPEPMPWPERVDGAELLDGLSGFFARYLALPPSGADLLALWSVQTHCTQRFRHTPRLAVRSPEKGCGKTTVLDLLELLVPRPLQAANVTPAAILRAIEQARPTLLIDEADTFLARSDDLRGILNTDHKIGGQIVRCVGDNAEPRAFCAFAPNSPQSKRCNVTDWRPTRKDARLSFPSDVPTMGLSPDRIIVFAEGERLWAIPRSRLLLEGRW